MRSCWSFATFFLIEQMQSRRPRSKEEIQVKPLLPSMQRRRRRGGGSSLLPLPAPPPFLPCKEGPQFPSFSFPLFLPSSLSESSTHLSLSLSQSSSVLTATPTHPLRPTLTVDFSPICPHTLLFPIICIWRLFPPVAAAAVAAAAACQVKKGSQQSRQAIGREKASLSISSVQLLLFRRSSSRSI